MHGFCPWRTVFQNISLVREKAADEEVQDIINAVGLYGFENYYPGQLSGGMARRCALARAFHYQGDLLLMDEPFQGLDYGLRMEMLNMRWISGANDAVAFYLSPMKLMKH